MKKSILSLAVAAGVSTTAMAQMHINHQGTGEALIYPLYTAQQGNDTYITVVNTTETAKAVKVRILEAQNSQEVLDFNLYMSPEDHFSFAITASGEGAKLVTADKSCTVPAIPAGGVDFVNNLFQDDKGADDAKTTTVDESFDNTGLSRTAIGHIEVIEMGQIAYSTDPKSVYQATLHDSDGVPGDCSAHTALWSDDKGTKGAWLAAAPGEADAGFVAGPWDGGGLYGYGQVVNVMKGTAFGYDAVAIDGLVDPDNALADGAALHYFPGDIDPNFQNGRLDSTFMVEALDGPQEAAAPILAVGALFQTTMLENDYVLDETINALTDWVITQPTKAAHVNEDDVADVIPPYNMMWDKRKVCEPVGMTSWDREEANPFIPPAGSVPPVFSPRPPAGETPDPESQDVPLCYETTIVQFGTDSAIGVDTVAIGVNDLLEGADGWARIGFGEDSIDTDDFYASDTDPDTNWQPRRISGTDADLVGLPVTGFAVIKYENGTLTDENGDGVLANYAVSTEHKAMTMTSN